MLIAIIQKENEKFYKWGMFDSKEKALDFIEYLKNSIIPSAIPSFIVAVATPAGITEYSLTEYEKEVDR